MKISFSNPLPLNSTYNIVNLKKTNKKHISFGKDSDEINVNNNREYEYAKEHLGEEDWESAYFDKRFSEIHPENFSDKLDNDFYAFINAFFILIPLMVDMFIIDNFRIKHAKKIVEPEIRRIREIMFQLNNEKIRNIEDEKKEYSIDLKNLEKDKTAKQDLYENFIKLLSNSEDKNSGIPTTIMIEGADKQTRKDIIKWTKEQISQRQSEFKLPVDEDEALYRITTEIEYAQNYYDKTGKRTVMFIENFANILNPEKVSIETITEMKAILSDIAEEQCPCSIIFGIDDESKLDKAFIGNRTRIPLIVKLSE